MMNTLAYGKEGEDLAISYLERNGYVILERNWRHRKAEIDIIALKGGTLAVVEVKTRNTDDYGKPQDFVNRKKIGLMVRAVNAYVTSRNLEVDVRFDIIGILGKGGTARLEHLEDAFFYFDV